MVYDSKSALAELEAHRPGSLLGLRETQWLDAKKAPYRVADDPKAVEELSKDVAAFANGAAGSSSSASPPDLSTTKRSWTMSSASTRLR